MVPDYESIKATFSLLMLKPVVLLHIQGADNSAWSTSYGNKFSLFRWGCWKSHGAYMHCGGGETLEAETKEASGKWQVRIITNAFCSDLCGISSEKW